MNTSMDPRNPKFFQSNPLDANPKLKFLVSSNTIDVNLNANNSVNTISSVSTLKTFFNGVKYQRMAHANDSGVVVHSAKYADCNAVNVTHAAFVAIVTPLLVTWIGPKFKIAYL